MSSTADTIEKAKADLELILDGKCDLDMMNAASLRVRKAISRAILEKEKATWEPLPECTEPTTEQIETAFAIGKKLDELDLNSEGRLDLLEASATRLTVADVKRVIEGAVLFVIEAQTYDHVTRLDNTSYMFEERHEPLGYFQGDEDTDVTGVGGGSDVWYVADAATLDALNK